jgi:hypothetical protein
MIKTRWKVAVCFGVLTAGLLAARAQAQTTVSTGNGASGSTVDVVTGTIQAAGPRQGNNGDRFFNIEGDGNTGFSSYGVLRFDLTGVKSTLDTTFGAGKYAITDVTLSLTQANAAFSAAGTVLVALTSDDTADIKTTNSPYKYPTPAPPDQEAITSLTFTPVATGTVDTVDLATNTAGSSDLISHILSSATVTLVLNPDNANTPAVAATYRGQSVDTTNNVYAPQLTITAVAANKVSGVITLQSCTAVAGNRVDLTFRPATGSPFTRTVTLAADGSFTATGIPPASYTVHIKGAKYLAKNVTVDASGGDVTDVAATLLPGDVNNDNKVGIIDLGLLADSYLKSQGQSGFNPNADLNCDDKVDILDLGLLADNYLKNGDP